MSPFQALQVIKSIENSFQTKSLVFKNVNWWPLIRITLCLNLIHEKKVVKYEHANYNNRWLRYLKNIHWHFNLCKSFIKQYSFVKTKISELSKIPNNQLGKLAHRTQKNVLFFTFSNYRQTANGSLYLDKFVDSYKFFLKDIQLTVVEQIVLNKTYTPKQHYSFSINKIFSRKQAFHFIKKFIRSFFNYSTSQKLPVSFDEVIQTIEKLGYADYIDIDLIRNKIDETLLYAKSFNEIIKKTNPKVGITPCYYLPEGMGFILACKQNEIKTIDIQHGTQGKYHFAFSSWSHVPGGGYGLLPDYFWNYSDADAQIINDCFKFKNHSAYTIGNTWISYWKKSFESQSHTTNIDNVDKSKPSILVSLQKDNPYLPSFILKYIADTQKRYNWLFRFHPNYINKEKLNHLLQSNRIERYEYETTSTLPLYQLLNEIDIHVTQYSTVAIEALEFGKKNLIISETGYQYFKQLCMDGTFTYATNYSEIKDFFEKWNQKSIHTNSSQSMVTEADCIKQNLNTFFKNKILQ